MLISVIVPTCNRNDLLSKCLDLLSPNGQSIDIEYELIVTDDGKGSQAKILIEEKYNWAKWVKGPQKGPAANRNNGAKNATGEWLIFIDDDVLPDGNLLQHYQTAIQQHPDCLAFEGAIIPDDWALMKNEMAECPINTEGNCFWSANICIQKQLFTRIGGFDELFLIAAQEDQDIFIRLTKHTVIPFLKDCVVTHPVRYGSISKKLKGIKIQFANWIYYTQKHSPMSIRKHLLESVWDYVKIAIKDILKLRLRYFFLDVIKCFYCLYLFFTYKKISPDS